MKTYSRPLPDALGQTAGSRTRRCRSVSAPGKSSLEKTMPQGRRRPRTRTGGRKWAMDQLGKWAKDRLRNGPRIDLEDDGPRTVYQARRRREQRDLIGKLTACSQTRPSQGSRGGAGDPKGPTHNGGTTTRRTRDATPRGGERGPRWERRPRG